MGPSCPRCEKSEFSYQALLDVHPYRFELSPARITCPACGLVSRVTSKSRVFAAFILIGLFVSCFLIVGMWISLQKWQMAVLGIICVVLYYFAIWPAMVRLKPWTEFHVWQPKNRLLGYFVFLLPAALVALGFYLAVQFKIGM